MVMMSCNYEPVKLYYFLFEVIRQRLSKCGLRSQCDGRRRFQLTYQPTDALNSGSLQNSFAFNRNVSPLTAIPKTSKM